MTKPAQTASRHGGLDVVRSVAIFGTVMIHATAVGGFNWPLGSLDWTANLAWSTLLRCAVPLFLMCSGALFLAPERELSLSVLWRKYILRIVVALFFWAAAYLLWNIYLYGTLDMASVTLSPPMNRMKFMVTRSIFSRKMAEPRGWIMRHSRTFLRRRRSQLLRYVHCSSILAGFIGSFRGLNMGILLSFCQQADSMTSDAFATAGEAQAFLCRGFHIDAIGRNSEAVGNILNHLGNEIL